MKIWGEIPKIPGIYNKQKSLNRVADTSEVSSKKDVVSISNHAKDFQTVLKALKDVPDIRQDKVTEMSEKYNTQSYNVDGKDMAAKILDSIKGTKG